jgi:Domain of unknown function (DUF1840)
MIMNKDQFKGLGKQLSGNAEKTYGDAKEVIKDANKHSWNVDVITITDVRGHFLVRRGCAIAQTDTYNLFEENSVLVTFTTDAYADITMFGVVALSMLRMMGHSTTVPGAILAADVPAALSLLTAAIDAERSTSPVAGKDADESEVSVAHRGLPLINLLTAAAKADSNVMWK